MFKESYRLSARPEPLVRLCRTMKLMPSASHAELARILAAEPKRLVRARPGVFGNQIEWEHIGADLFPGFVQYHVYFLHYDSRQEVVFRSLVGEGKHPFLSDGTTRKWPIMWYEVYVESTDYPNPVFLFQSEPNKFIPKK